MNFKVDKISGAKKYSSTLDLGVNAGYENPVYGKYGASIGYQKVKSSTENNENLFTQTKAKCCVYIGEVLSYTMPKYHPNFLEGLSSLTEDYDQGVYRRYSCPS